MARKRQALRCSAQNRQGQPCGRYAVLGTAVCPAHGSSPPQVRQAARLRLALDVAGRLLESMDEDGRADPRIGPRDRDPTAFCQPPGGSASWTSPAGHGSAC
jgi:hypothetical protein